MSLTVERLAAESMDLWNHCATAWLPDLGRRFRPEEQSVKEKLLDHCLASIEKELVRAPRTKEERAAAHERITSAFVQFARSALELDDRHLAILLERGFPEIGTSMGRMARRF